MLIATAPAAANQTGSIPTTELSREPSQRERQHREREPRQFGRAGRAPAWRGRSRSTAKKRLNTTHSMPTAANVGSAISAPKCKNDSLLAWKASRLVRFDTGNSSDAELARCAHA